MKTTKAAFPFVIDELLPLQPRIRPMFGCHAVYVDEKIVLILRNKPQHPEANGIWIATSFEHHESLRKDLPNMRSVYVLSDGKNETGWQMISCDDDDFETAALKVCSLVRKRDERIGKVPKPRKKKK